MNPCSGVYTAGVATGIAVDLFLGGKVAAAKLSKAGYAVSGGRYAHGGGGINLIRHGRRIFALDWHAFKLNGRMVNRLHYHAGRTKSAMKKHRPWQRPGGGGGVFRGTDSAGHEYMPQMKPQFPISVRFQEDEDVWTHENEEELACNLEWFDSEDPEERADVVDALGRPVLLKVVRLQVVELKLKNDEGSD